MSCSSIAWKVLRISCKPSGLRRSTSRSRLSLARAGSASATKLLRDRLETGPVSHRAILVVPRRVGDPVLRGAIQLLLDRRRDAGGKMPWRDLAPLPKHGAGGEQ